MNYIVDTHLLVWAAGEPWKLPAHARSILEVSENTLWVSVVSLWEIALKRSLNRPDFRAEVGPFRAGLLANGYTELPINSRHILPLPALPFHHTDPFDRLLVAQAVAEGMTLLTADRTLARYGAMVLAV